MGTVPVFPHHEPLTHKDLESITDEGRRYELVDGVLAEDTVLIPDVVVGRREDYTERALVGVPVLAVEVLSPSSRLIDTQLKRATLARAGCPHYWIIDPYLPSLLCLTLRDGEYVVAAEGLKEDLVTVNEPFLVTLRPADLVSDY